MSPPAAQLLLALCFVCIRPILTNLFSVEHFCPLNIRFNRALTSLNLKDNETGAGGAKAIAHALHQSTLRSLAINMALDIEQLKTSTSIDLSSKGLRYEEAIIVAKCIEFNRALNSVDLRDNIIPDAGKQQLRDAVKGKNTTLQL